MRELKAVLINHHPRPRNTQKLYFVEMLTLMMAWQRPDHSHGVIVCPYAVVGFKWVPIPKPAETAFRCSLRKPWTYPCSSESSVIQKSLNITKYWGIPAPAVWDPSTKWPCLNKTSLASREACTMTETLQPPLESSAGSVQLVPSLAHLPQSA